MTETQHPISGPRWQRFIRSLVYMVVLVVDVTGLALTLLSLGWLAVGDSNLFTWHFSNMMPAIIALSPIVAIVGLMGRRRWFAFYLIPALLFIGLYGEQFIPRDMSPAYNDTQQLRVMTFNTRYKTDSAPKLAEIILDSNADVIALQELSTPAAYYFAEHLIDAYPYQITHTDGISVIGKGLLSRYPLINDSLEQFDSHFYILRAQLEFDSETITIVNTHPAAPKYGIAYNSKHRTRHTNWLMERLEQEHGRIILLGDFNTTQHSDDYAKLTQDYQDSFRDVGWGLGQTFPDGSGFRILNFVHPLIRIDYIFHTDDLKAIKSQVWHTSGGSDHRPVVTDFVLNR